MEELKYKLFKLRNPGHFDKLKAAVYPSSKGDFSLRPIEEHKAIFIHITKTAGTSVAIALFGYLPYHYKAWQYRVIFGRKKFNEYYKFAFVRNPWDRLYSAYNYLKEGGWDADDAEWASKHLSGINSFEQFVSEWLDEDRIYSHMHFWPQSDFICDRLNRFLVDDIYYFETISSDFEIIASKLNIKTSLEHRNKTKFKKTYLDAYSEETKRKVKNLYSRDIKNFNYSFDSFERIDLSYGR